MKGFERNDRWFSLCGLNCALCPMYLGKYCPGCGQGEGNQSCAIARCSLEHDRVEYCFLCKEYPCSKYQNIDEADSFITHQNQKKDIEKAITIGIKAYCDEQKRKEQILHFLLEQFNDGRKKTLYSTAVNLLEESRLEDMICRLQDEHILKQPLQEKAAAASQLLKQAAESQGVSLKLRKASK